MNVQMKGRTGIEKMEMSASQELARTAKKGAGGQYVEILQAAEKSSYAKGPTENPSQIFLRFKNLVLVLRRSSFFLRQFLGCCQRVRDWNLDVRFYAGAFPIRLRNRIDRPGKRNANHEVIIDPVT